MDRTRRIKVKKGNKTLLEPASYFDFLLQYLDGLKRQFPNQGVANEDWCLPSGDYNAFKISRKEI